MAGNRKFSKAFKRQVVEEFLAGEGTQAQLARRYGVSDSLIFQWRRRYAEGKLEETASPSDKDDRIKELERMVGRLTMENELLKKGVRFALLRENERSSMISGPISNRSSGDAK
jgi:transposase